MNASGASTLRLGLIGAGATRIMYAPVLPALEQSTGARLVAIADPSPEQRALFCQAFPDPIADQYEDAATMVQQTSLDAVLIASPPFLHQEHTLLAASNGLHIYCEKPMARTTVESQQMIDACHVPRYATGARRRTRRSVPR